MAVNCNNDKTIKMHNFEEIYERILEVLKKISPEQLQVYQRRKPKMSDLEVVGLSLTGEYLGIDSEHDLFRKLPLCYGERIERSVFNRRRRRLFGHIEHIRKGLADILNRNEGMFIVDSMPLEVCKLSRSGRSTVCREEAFSAPDRGYCASQGCTYYGYKLHAVCSKIGVFHSLDISPASVHDIHYLKDIKGQMASCTVLGDKGYLSAKWQLDLFNTCKIKLETPMRTNQKGYGPQPFQLRKCRKRIETLFSQLCDQFMIRRNYAKTFEGFKTRIMAKVTALTMVQYINKFVFGRNINNIKINIV